MLPVLALPPPRTHRKDINWFAVLIVAFWCAPAAMILFPCRLVALFYSPYNTPFCHRPPTPEILIRPPNHHRLQHTRETGHKWSILYYHDATTMIYRSNRVSKCPYSPHITQNIPLEPPKWAKSQLNVPQMLLSSSTKAHRKARTCFLIPYHDIWYHPHAVVVIVHGSVSPFWCLRPPLKILPQPPTKLSLRLRGNKTFQNPANLFIIAPPHIMSKRGWYAIWAIRCLHDQSTPHVGKFDPSRQQKSAFS